MYTLNDEWSMEHLLSHVEKVGEELGYSFVYLDACGCVGQKAPLYVEKDGIHYQIQFEELYHAYWRNTIPAWLRRLTS